MPQAVFRLKVAMATCPVTETLWLYRRIVRCLLAWL